MSYLDLALFKKHLAVFHDDDDELLQLNLDAAEAYCAHYMNREAIADAQFRPWTYGWGMPQLLGEADSRVPKSVCQAILLVGADFYENRVKGIVGTIYTENPAAMALLDQQRVGLGA